jgi:predicted Rossmann fold nucleotide-binding protein DprA/Smf involved in DNA uptake
MEYLGNQDILKHYKIGFLCSRSCPAEIVLKSYEWAKQQRELGNCIVCGNHSQIEKDVFDILLKGKQPLILVLARSMKNRWSSAIKNALMEDRLLIVSPFQENAIRVTSLKAEKRNRLILSMSGETYVPYYQPNGMLSRIINTIKT